MERNRNLFWNLLEPEHPKAEAFSRKLMGNREDGDDLYQDALVLALTAFASLNETAAFRPWLYRIIVNCFKNRFRTPWYRKVIPMTEEIGAQLKTADPSNGYAVSRTVQKALAAISIEERALITLFELEGWSIAELAGIYNKPAGTIKARLSRARKKMKNALLKKENTNKTVSHELKSISHSPSNITPARIISTTAATVSPSTVSQTYQK